MRQPQLKIAFCLLALMGAAASFAHAEPEALALVGGDLRISGPAMASHGFMTAVAAVVSSEGTAPRLHLVTMKDAVSDLPKAPERFREVAPGAPGTDSFPDLFINPVTNRAALLWLRSHEGTTTLHFQEQGAPLESLTTAEGLIEWPTLVMDSAGIAYAAWTETVGSVSQVRAATRTADGWTLSEIAAPSDEFSLFPQLFPQEGSGAHLFFYVLRGDSFSLDKRALGPDGAALVEPAPSEFPAARLPLLVPTEHGYGALWLEQTDFGELYLEMRPRADGSYRFRELTGGRHPVSQIAVARSPRGAMSWIEQPAAAESTMVVLTGEDPVRFDLPPVASNPVLSQSSNWRHLLWISQDMDAGDAHLWYRRLPR